MLDDWLSPLALYCERTAMGGLGEPLDLLSNLSFVIAAWGIWRLAASAAEAKQRRNLQILAAVAVSIAIGSALFHAWPMRLTQAADVTPISLFVATCILMHRRALISEGETFRSRLIAVLGFMFGLAAIARIQGWPVAHGEFYLGIVPSLLLFGWRDRHPQRAKLFLQAGLVFSLALTARSIDRPICPYFSHGTHFIWHLLNGVVVYLMARGESLPSFENRPA